MTHQATLHDLDASLTPEQIETMVMIGAVDVARAWIKSSPAALPHVQAGSGIELVLTLTDMPSMQLNIVDSNGARYLVTKRELLPTH